MSVNRCIGSGPKIRRTGSIRGWGEHVATIGDEVVFNALEDDSVSGNWSCLLVVDDVHVNSCRLTIGVDIVCGGERLADDVVVCRRTAAVRLSMLCCCLTSIYCQFAPALCWWRLFVLEYRIACCSVRKLVNLKAFASLLFCVNGGGWTGEIAVKWKGSTGDSGKNWYESLTVVPSWIQRRFASAFCFLKDRSSSKLASFCLFDEVVRTSPVLFQTSFFSYQASPPSQIYRPNRSRRRTFPKPRCKSRLFWLPSVRTFILGHA